MRPNLPLIVRAKSGSPATLRPMNEYATEYASLRFLLLLSVEAFAFLAVMAYSLSAIRRGGWAVLGALGGAIGGLAALALAIGWRRWSSATTSAPSPSSRNTHHCQTCST
jgi:hypothetical protein